MKRRFLRFLGSRALSSYLLIIASIYYIFLFAWSITSPNKVVVNISRTLPFIFLYGLFFINLILCIIERIPVIVKRLSTRPIFLKSGETIKVEINNLTLLEKIIKKNHYRIISKDDDSIFFIKGRYGAISELVFHIFFIFILSGVLLSNLTHFEGKAIVVEGYSFWGEYNEYIEKPSENLFFVRAPELSFRVDRVGAEFWEDKLFFTDLYAEIIYPADTMEHRKFLRLKSGMWIRGIFLNILGMGYAPVFVIKDKSGNVLNSAIVNLNVFPPPTEDSFVISGLPYRVYLRFYPDAVIDGNQIEPGVMWVQNPVYVVRVMRGKRPVFKGILKPGEEARFEGYSLYFPEVKKWAQIRITRDYGIQLIVVGFLTGILGIFWKIFFFRREIELRRVGRFAIITVGAEIFNILTRNRALQLLKNSGIPIYE